MVPTRGNPHVARHLHHRGQAGFRVSPFCLGTKTFGEDISWDCFPEEIITIIAESLDCGGNFIGVANIYTYGHPQNNIRDLFKTAREGREKAAIEGKAERAQPRVREAKRIRLSSQVKPDVSKTGVASTHAAGEKRSINLDCVQ